jgi:predicted dehydrogenase
MRKLRVGIIGLGHVAQVCHLPAYENVDAIEVVAGAELQKNLLNEVSSRWHLKGYDNYEDMLKKEELDIACITTGPKYSPKITERAAEFGVNVLVEKPIALTLEDAKSMIAKCKKEHVKLCYGETFRFFPTCMRAKELIDEGRLGDLFLLMETVIGGQGPENFSSCRIYPPGAPGAGPMGLTDHGIHLIDVFRWLTRSEVEWVFGRGNRSGEKASTEFLTMKFRNGTIGQLVYNEASYPSDMPYEGIFSWGSYWAGGVSTWESHPANFRVHGTRGALRVFTYPNKLFYFTKDNQEEIRVLDRPHPKHFGLQMETFAKCIAGGEEPKVTGIDGLKALQIILAAYESYEHEKVVRIQPE